jgi:hypothetical protein
VAGGGTQFHRTHLVTQTKTHILTTMMRIKTVTRRPFPLLKHTCYHSCD